MYDPQVLKRRLEREKKARKEAENILENKAQELYAANESLKALNNSKDALLDAVSAALSNLFTESDLDKALQNATKIIAKSQIADRVTIIELKFLEGHYSPEKVFSYSNFEKPSLTEVFSTNAEIKPLFNEFVRKDLEGNKTVKISEYDDNSDLADRVLEIWGLCSSVLIPIYYRGQMHSIISMDYFEEVYEWSKITESIILAFAAGVESAIERTAQKEEIESQKNFYENILNSIPSDLVVFDTDHTYQFINPIAIRDKEVRDWLIGKNDYDYVKFRNKPVELADKRRNMFKGVLESRKAISFEERFINTDGNEEWMLRTLFPVIDEFHNQIEMIIGYGLDITEIKQTEKQLILAREEAENSRNMKQKFLANMSHEIRTPMNGVVGIVHLMERTNLDKDQKRYLDILRESSEHLLHLINDILDVSKIEEGKLVLVESPVQLNTIIEGVVQNLKSRIEDKNLGLEVTGLEIFETHLLTDPVRVRQILLNLLTNAIKFTHKGKISLHCETIKETKKYQTFKIEVQDSGIGIPDDKLDHIFQAFDQESGEISTQYGGTGLGLNIVKELIEKMKGRIEVESKLDEGSIFRIILKMEKSEAHHSAFKDHRDWMLNENAFIGKTILLADDHEINYTVASETIEVLGAHVLYARDGQEAVNMVIEKDIDLILMDMQMPNMDGIEATKLIRLLGAPKGTTPIIAMTAAALPEEREKCLASGMNDYLAKPYNPNNLFQILSNHLLGTDTPNIPSSHTNLNTKQLSSSHELLYDLSYLEELSGNNTKFIMDMITSFKNEMPEMIEDMIRNLELKNPEKIRQISHKASSLAGYLGCNHLRTLLKEIELKSEDIGSLEYISQLLEEVSTNYLEIDKQLNEVQL